MITRLVPPAGNSINLYPKTCEHASLSYAGFTPLYVNSGTAALALALLMARLRAPSVQYPEALMPAYACPDLVAAARYAGVRPLLVDVGAEDPGMNASKLRLAISENCIAVIAPSFLGIREDFPAIREAIGGRTSILLIEDSAQWLPDPAMPEPINGDCAILSFGRGKPVSLLGGGALLIREADSKAALESCTLEQANRDPLWRAKASLYNLLRRPALYGSIQALGFLGLGATRFKPLDRIEHMNPRKVAMLPALASSYLSSARRAEEMLDAAVPQNLKIPATVRARCGRLLRYPVLCRRGHRFRDGLMQEFRNRGIGASAMYGRPLIGIAGISEMATVVGGDEGATTFAAQILTLPIHDGVRPRDIEVMKDVLGGWERG